jgi:hypothetical protein
LRYEGQEARFLKEVYTEPAKVLARELGGPFSGKVNKYCCQFGGLLGFL